MHNEIIIQFPEALHPHRADKLTTADDQGSSFDVSAQGNGSFTGLGYTIPAHTKGSIKAKIQTLCMTSQDVANLNQLVKGMVSASDWQQVTDYEATHVSADLSFFGMISGGGSASYDKTHTDMSGFGLTSDQITTIVEAMAKIASQMSSVEIDFEVDNTQNDYSVSGSLMLYTIGGTIKSDSSEYQYRMLAGQGTAGASGDTAPASGTIIPLN
ncbi:MAG: hypothetical protein ABI162_06255 [Luteolibacter sp.]